MKRSLLALSLVAISVAIFTAMGGVKDAQAYTISLTIEKVCSSGSGGSFPITAHNASVPQADQSGAPACGGSFSVTLDNARVYDVYETVPDGWEFESVDCGSTTQYPGLVITTIPGTVAYSTDGVRFDTSGVTGTPSITCTFTNASLGIPLTVEKDCHGYDSGEIFAFTLAGTNGITGPIDPEEQTIACGGTAEFTLPIQGNYTVTETVPDGWTLNPLTGPDFDAGDCETTSGTNNVHYIYGDVDNGVRIEVPAAGAIDSQAVTCTFTNDPPTIPLTITKDCGNFDSNQEFTFTLTGTLPAGVDPIDPQEATLACGETAQPFDLLPQGNYTLAETVPDNWNLEPLTGPDFDAGSCETTSGNNNVHFIYGDVDNGVRLEVPAVGAIDAQAVTCTFVNDPDTGTIIIDKAVNHDLGSTTFAFSDNIPGCDIGSLGSGDSITCSDVPVGSYHVTETNPSPYLLSDIRCDPEADTSLSSRTASFDLGPRETVHCVFSNVAPADPGSITIIKDTNPTSSGVYFDFDSDLGNFQLADGGSKTFTSLTPATYKFSENAVDGWELVDVNCSNDALVTYGIGFVSINLQAGEGVTCVFRNDHITVTTAGGSLAVPTQTHASPPTTPPSSTPPPTSGVGGITPPSTGDAGLLAGNSTPWFLGVLSVLAGSAIAWLALTRRSGQS